MGSERHPGPSLAALSLQGIFLGSNCVSCPVPGARLFWLLLSTPCPQWSEPREVAALLAICGVRTAQGLLGAPGAESGRSSLCSANDHLRAAPSTQRACFSLILTSSGPDPVHRFLPWCVCACDSPSVLSREPGIFQPSEACKLCQHQNVQVNRLLTGLAVDAEKEVTAHAKSSSGKTPTPSLHR